MALAVGMPMVKPSSAKQEEFIWRVGSWFRQLLTPSDEATGLAPWYVTIHKMDGCQR